MAREVVLDVEKVNREVLQACLAELGADMTARIAEAEKELSGLGLRFAKKSAETLKLFKADQTTDIVAIMAAEGALIETRKVVLATFLAAPDAGLAAAMQDRLIELTAAVPVVAKKTAGTGTRVGTGREEPPPAGYIMYSRNTKWLYRIQAGHIYRVERQGVKDPVYELAKDAREKTPTGKPALLVAPVVRDNWADMGEFAVPSSGTDFQRITTNLDRMTVAQVKEKLAGEKCAGWVKDGGGNSLVFYAPAA